MKTTLLLFGILLSTLPLIAVAQTPAPPQFSDKELAEAVEKSLKADEKLSGAGIEAEAEEGVVTLKGKVLGKVEADRAVSIAKRIPGVARVESKLEVDTYITNEDVNERLENEEEAAVESNEEKSDRSAGTVLNDAGITSSVKLKLAKDDVVSAYRIDVDTRKGEVTLTGTVKSELEAKRAIEIANSVEGVNKVTSVLTIKPE